MTQLICTSCGSNILAKEFYSKFPCPSCLKQEIIRCQRCKSLSNPYVCPACNFEGP